MKVITGFKLMFPAVLLIVLISASSLIACPPPKPSRPDHEAGGETGEEINRPDTEDPSTDPGDTGGTSGGDPVLLGSGEFMFTRTDSVTSNTGLAFDFPIVRTYRSEPAAVIQNVGRDIDGFPIIGQMPGDDPSVVFYADVCYFRWKDPYPHNDPTDPYDQDYLFSASFEITPETDLVEVPYSTIPVMPPDAGSSWHGKAYRFKLGTGTRYQVKIIYTCKEPFWMWSPERGWFYNYYIGPFEIDRWETSFTIPEFPGNGNNIPTSQDSPLSRGAHNHIDSAEWTPGWDMSYNMHLIEYPDSDPSDGVDDRMIRFYSGDGNIYTYKPSSVPDPILGSGWRCSTRNDFLKITSSGNYNINMKNNKVLLFDSGGNISSIYYKGRTVFSFNYSGGYGINKSLKRLEYIGDVYGRKTKFSYVDASDIFPGNLSKITDWAGRQWSYYYYPDGNLKTATDPEGNRETYSYDADGRLDKILDNDNIMWLDNDYDTQGRVVFQTMGTETFTFSYNGSEVTVTDSKGAATTSILNSDGYQLSKETQTDTASVTASYTYDSKNQLKSITYPEKNGYVMNYDSYGNLTEVTRVSSDAADPNLTYTLGYDTSYSRRCYLTSVTDPKNNTTSYDYDTRGRLIKITYPEVTTDLGPAVPDVDFTYYSDNHVETVTSPDGIVIKYEYCNDDITEPNSLGRIKKVTVDYGTDPACKNIIYNISYDVTGKVVSITNPDTYTTKLTYNDLSQLAQIENPAGDITRLTYNTDRKLKKIENAFNGGWQTFEYGYNVMAKLTTITDSLGRATTIGYDSRYKADSVVDANTNETKKQYNKRKLVKEIIDAELGSTKFAYDDNGRLSVITDAKNADTTYQYDRYGRLEKVIYDDLSYEQYGYDLNSNPTSFRNRAGETITFTYDVLDRLLTKTRPGESAITLTYDIGGHLVDISQGTAAMGFAYDRLGRLEQTTDQNSKTVGYEYDNMGRRTKLIYPDNTYITYEYDNVGRLKYIKDQNGDKIVWYQYDGLSRTAQVSYYHGITPIGGMTYDFEDKVAVNNDNLGSRIAKIDYNCSPAHSISYTYDNVGNVKTTDVGGNYGWTYGYDSIYQVTDADQGTATNRQVDFGYDKVYNRTLWTDTLGSVNLAYSDNNMNQYTAVGSTTPTYDSRGNMTAGDGGGFTFTYDCENRLVKANNIFYNMVYTYDLLGRRNSKWDTAATYPTDYVWDGAHIIAEYENGSLTKKYIYGPGMDNPVAMINVSGTSESWYYYYSDAQGNVRLMTNDSGYVIESYTYDPFGRPRIIHSAGSDNNWLTEDVPTDIHSWNGNPYLFTGRRWDIRTGLYYYRFRDYSPKLGRFLQTDPLQYIDGMNMYAYCNNNPTNWIDPWGLKGKNGKKPGFIERMLQTIIGKIPIIGPALTKSWKNKDLDKKLKENADNIGTSDNPWLDESYRQQQKKNWEIGVKEVEELGNDVIDIVKDAAGKAIIDPLVDMDDNLKDIKDGVDAAKEVYDATKEASEECPNSK